jgi:hypothetical protein
MLFRETVAVYCENHMEHTNILCEKNAEYIKAGGTYTNHRLQMVNHPHNIWWIVLIMKFKMMQFMLL